MRYRFLHRLQLRNGFTLIELLVSTAVIATLAVILFPVLCVQTTGKTNDSRFSAIDCTTTACPLERFLNNKTFTFGARHHNTNEI
jgi:prepilin-type N-terminal cleavage/methylation domain-containing protein